MILIHSWDTSLISNKHSNNSNFLAMTSADMSKGIITEEHYDQPQAEADSGIQSPSTMSVRYKPPRQATYPEQSSPLPAAVSGYPSRQLSLPTSMAIETNGIFSPQPLTTSQHHPPKIRLLNRSSAVNLSSPTPTDSSSQPSSAEDLQQTTAVHLSDEALHVSSGSQRHLGERSTSEESSTGASSGKSSERPPLQKDSSFDYKDSSGIDLHEFIVKTLRENPRDRMMLLKLEKDFNHLIRDQTKMFLKYPAMTSYHRMLVHRVAAYFGLEHNVDSTGKCVIVNKTTNTRIPEHSFQIYCSQEYTDEDLSFPKSILTRRSNTTSSEEGTLSPRPGSPVSTKRTMEDKKSKSIEERTEEYIKSTTSSQSSGDGQEQLLIAPLSPNLPVVTPSTTASSQPMETAPVRPVNWPPRLQALEQQRNAERNAALAATAALTGGKVPVDNKKLSEKSPRYPVPQAMSGYAMPWGGDGTLGMEHSLVSYPAGVNQPVAVAPGAAGHSQPGLLVGISADGISPGTVVVNPATGTPVLGPDGLPLVYQSGYLSRGNVRQMSPSTLVYATQPAASSAQQGAYQFVMPVPQMGGGPQYVVVQQAGQQGRVSVPQSPQDMPGAQTPGNLSGQLQHVGYQDLTSQVAAMSLTPRPEGGDEESGPADSYTATSPTADVAPHMFFTSQGQYYMLPQQGRPVIPGQMYQGQSMPAHYLSAQGLPSFNQCPYPQYTSGEPPGRYSQSRTPPAQQRSTSPVVVTPHYVSGTPPSSQQSYTRPSSAQTPPFQRTPPPSQVQQYFRGIFQPSMQAVQGSGGVYTHMGGSQVHYSSGQISHQQLVSTGQPAWRGHPTGKRGSKVADSAPHADVSPYRSLVTHENPRVQNNITSFGSHQRPLVTMIPVSPYPHVPTNRFFPSPSPYGQFIPTQPVHRKSRPRPQTTTQKAGSSRSTPHSTSSSSSDQDHKTVNHILEVYDLPEDLTASETDNLLVDLGTAGARILRINNSGPASGQSSSGTSCPTVLAIFKSAGEAQRALETVKNPRYKLRVSQKSPTHFSGDGSLNRSAKGGTVMGNSSSSPST